MGITFKSAPEYKSIDAFVQFCYEDERSEYTHEDLHALGYRLRMRIQCIRHELAKWGLVLANREVPKHVRGFTTSSNDRWFGPGSSKTYGGSGFDNFE